MPAKGVFCDNAMDIVLEYYPKPTKARKTEFIKTAMAELNKHGIVGMHDAGVVPADLELYEELANDPDWTVRVNAMIECDVRNTFCPGAVRKVSTPNGRFHVNSVKLFGGLYTRPTLNKLLTTCRWGFGLLGLSYDRAVQRQTGVLRLFTRQRDYAVTCDI